MMDSSFLDIKRIKKYFAVSRGIFRGKTGMVKAVDGVDLTLARGETLGLVGESGCGKSTLGRLILRLDEPTDGNICFEGKDIQSFTGEMLKDFRKKVQIVFQDPYASLNPRKTAGDTISEPLIINGMASSKSRRELTEWLFEKVGLSAEQWNRYPHEFSGGQRQRIGIARALVLKPRLIVADEPVSALDVSIQAQILNLLKDLQAEFDLTYLFITHDLSVVRFMSDRIAVMYAGRIVEIGTNEDIYHHPLHPYTKILLAAIPSPVPGKKKQPMEIKGHASSAESSESACIFLMRCPFRMSICEKEKPVPEIKTARNHMAACHLPIT
ncbi:MAG: ATP-binding cassette domain-containing protein [Syntrophales bacterium]|nr:ATP-binding cassette domain-containing protein [Syntrophales bacterium]